MRKNIPSKILTDTEIRISLGEYLELVERMESAEKTVAEIISFAEATRDYDKKKHDKWDIGKYILEKFGISEDVEEEQNE